MSQGLSRKIIEYALTFLVIVSMNFFLPRLMPGDPFTFLSTEEGSITIIYTKEQIDRYKAYYGLDQPLLRQYVTYLARLGRGDLGYSIYFNETVGRIILNRIPWTLTISIIALVLGGLGGTLLGSLSAWRRNESMDQGLYLIMIVCSEIPTFLVGVFLLFFVAARLRWFPLAGGITPFANFKTGFARFNDLAAHAFLPIMTLSVTRLADFYLLARNTIINVLTKDFMRTAQAKGLRKRRLLFRHALKNALAPVVTRAFLSLGTVFNGAIMVENVFNYPGVGRLLREAVIVRDYPLIQGVFLFMTVTVLIMNLLAEVVYKQLDPRVN